MHDTLGDFLVPRDEKRRIHDWRSGSSPQDLIVVNTESRGEPHAAAGLSVCTESECVRERERMRERGITRGTERGRAGEMGGGERGIRVYSNRERNFGWEGGREVWLTRGYRARRLVEGLVTCWRQTLTPHPFTLHPTVLGGCSTPAGRTERVSCITRRAISRQRK